MRNIKMTIEYDGTRYKGWQKQNIKGTSINTIQDKLEILLEKMTGEKIQLIGCGRTDSGVHAKNYIANFKTNTILSIEEMMQYCKKYLPEDIVIRDMKNASERFHARLNILSKTYIYTIDNNEYQDVFVRKFAWHIEKKLDIKKMREASKFLLGTHDFQSFTSLKAKNGKSTVRKINYINIEEKDNLIKIEFNGNGFLLNMVRILTGTLVKVGMGEIEPSDVLVILNAKKRAEAGEKAPAKGLCMWCVNY
ncbi:tRNA pseudouridine(38-40) synthase TruA [Sarcina sp. JB2]|uniref:tRNA pseudouridine(38-40) synthase TruA n=1 Tax=Candidatus Sarcina troglodytae TaxID=2726954 RepID=A0ACD1BCS2_9CLOT|nr:tRNA pseudouridine(38-40) synthase TruA [Sarcina sp. JB2]QPJ85193.1 tRNA pseudouridine(38-40) synthase TruA [Sarcina sp. JB2]